MVFGHVIAQNNFGSLQSNYMPTNSLYVNPSSMLDSKVWLDVNLIGTGTYVNNDFVYFEDQSLISLIQASTNGSSRDTENSVRYNQNRNKYHAYNRTFVHLPSAVWNQGDHAVGLSLGGRSYTGIRKVPDYVAQFIENGVTQYTLQHDVDYELTNLKAASISFAEIKLSYAHTFLKKGNDMFMGGATVSKFFSIMGGATNIYDFNFNVNSDSLMAVGQLEMDAMYTPEPKFNTKGGLGLDLGFTWQRMMSDATNYYPNSPKSGCKELPYLWKLGVSIVDIGSVKFDPDDILFAGYNFDSYDWADYADIDPNENNFTDLFAAQESNITEGRVKKPYKVRLPTFVSVQFDYNIWASRFYVNGTIIQGLPVGKNKFGLRHANSLSITPRFETLWFEATMPLSLYEYKYPQMGLALRFGPVTVGSDKIINWLVKSRLYGGDIYAHVKIPIKYNPKCKTRSKNSSKNGRGKNGRSKWSKRDQCDPFGIN